MGNEEEENIRDSLLGKGTGVGGGHSSLSSRSPIHFSGGNKKNCGDDVSPPVDGFPTGFLKHK